MAQQWLYARDQITINSDLATLIHNEVAAQHLAPGDTIVLAARTCIQDPTYVWTPPGFNVLVVADSYVYGPGSSQGGIHVSGSPGTAGPTGVTGTAGVASADNPVDGGPGGPGGAGTAGGPATSITVLARVLDPVVLRVAGGTGGAGGAGGVGGAGAHGRIINRHPPITIEGSAPGPGGNGGIGGAGGPGGPVSVVYVSPGPRGVPQYALDSVAGGAGGFGGAAGGGGASGAADPGAAVPQASRVRPAPRAPTRR